MAYVRKFVVAYFNNSEILFPSNKSWKCLCFKEENMFRLEELKAAVPERVPYITTFGPTVDNLMAPADPKKSMVQYSDIFKK